VYQARTTASSRQLARRAGKLRGDSHERGIEVLLDVKLRAASPQSDGQVAGDLQAKDPRTQVSPIGRRLFRANPRRRSDLVQTQDRHIPRRTVGPRHGRVQAQMTRAGCRRHFQESHCGVSLRQTNALKRLPLQRPCISKGKAGRLPADRSGSVSKTDVGAAGRRARSWCSDSSYVAGESEKKRETGDIW
jgi:hypothetical protein